MDLAIETAHDLIRIINAYPQWRKQIRESLFPEVDLPNAFEELAEAQRHMQYVLISHLQPQRGEYNIGAVRKAGACVCKLHKLYEGE